MPCSRAAASTSGLNDDPAWRRPWVARLSLAVESSPRRSHVRRPWPGRTRWSARGRPGRRRGARSGRAAPGPPRPRPWPGAPGRRWSGCAGPPPKRRSRGALAVAPKRTSSRIQRLTSSTKYAAGYRSAAGITGEPSSSGRGLGPGVLGLGDEVVGQHPASTRSRRRSAGPSGLRKGS
jgi:hypothetical protein